MEFGPGTGICSISGLYEGVAQLGYTVKDVMNCFVNKSEIFKGESGSFGT